ncbi:MAG: hypothetical protein HUJ56_00285 [Erysipelotrichaceae bacterium]|nr:hypothetical protein [Erysipelotrichaceae bacterium]
MWSIQYFSTTYQVRYLTPNDIDKIYPLYLSQPTYFESMNSLVSKESIVDDRTSLPPNTPKENKYYVAYFKENELVAVLDLINHYPSINEAYTGLGSSLISELITYLTSTPTTTIKLSYALKNASIQHFWHKMGFKDIKKVNHEYGKMMIAKRKMQE